METIDTTLNSLNGDNFKLLLNSRLVAVFETRFLQLEEKFPVDINSTLEGLKYDYYDSLKKCKYLIK